MTIRDPIRLIYCADGNKRFAEIAIEAGFLYGARLPARGLHFPIYFADQDWQKPDRARYLAELAVHRPQLATVLDWERTEQLVDLLAWAEDAAAHVDEVVIIPKVFEGIKKLPRQIGGKRVRLGYSIPTQYGGTQTPVWEFYGWPVHLLGGSPKRQMEIAHYLNVISADGNYAQMMAVKYNEFWLDGNWRELKDYGGEIKQDAPYKAFRRSCENIMKMWGY